MGIYWCKAPEYLILFQLACLATFLVGSAHYILTFTFEILAFGFKLMKKICTSKNKVMPIHSNVAERKDSDGVATPTLKEEKK